MNPWLTAALSAVIVIGVLSVRAILMRRARKRRPRLVEAPNSHYTSQLVLDRDSSERWRSIPLDRMHEINRGEVRRLIVKLDEYGIEGMSKRDRMFLDRMAELNPPPQDHLPPTTKRQDAFWSDPFGFETRLGTPDGGR
jgi:hypothetical protein